MQIGVLASGGGTNLQSIIDACFAGEISGEVALVISNNSAAGALERAQCAGIPTLHLSKKTHPEPNALDSAMLEGLRNSGVELVTLAGYMKKIGPATLRAYKNKVLNIHPALLPDFGGQGMYGMSVHRAVLASGAVVTGPTVHVVNSEYDAGPVLAQEEVQVLAGDTGQSLQKRVLEAEHRLYPSTIEAFIHGQIAIYETLPDTAVCPLCIEKDFNRAVDVIRSAFRDPAERFNITKDNCPSHPSFTDTGKLNKIVAGGGIIFGAYTESRMVGCVAIEPSGEIDTWYLEKLAVLPANSRSGLGSLLLDHACKAIGLHGGERVSIGMIDADSTLKAWYTKRGFEEFQTRDFPHLPFTVCFMKKDMK